jgi:hypothetical protein
MRREFHVRCEASSGTLFGHAGILVTECDVSMHEITDHLHSWPAKWCATKERPCPLHHQICFTIAAAEEVDEGLLGRSATACCSAARR